MMLVFFLLACRREPPRADCREILEAVESSSCRATLLARCGVKDLPIHVEFEDGGRCDAQVFDQWTASPQSVSREPDGGVLVAVNFCGGCSSRDDEPFLLQHGKD